MQWNCGVNAGRPLRGHRPRALVVRARVPQRERTRARPQAASLLGKFIPQLVETLLDPVHPAGRTRARSFCGVGHDARPVARERPRDSAGVDVAAFNCLLIRVKTARVTTSSSSRGEIRDGARAESSLWTTPGTVPGTGLCRAAGSLHEPPPSCSRSGRRSSTNYAHADVLRVVLARAARSARLTAHFDLDFPASRSGSRTGVTSTSASAVRSSGPTTSSAATPWTRWRGSRPSPESGAGLVRRHPVHGDAESSRSGGPFDALSPRRRTRA